MTDLDIVELSPKGRYSKFSHVIGEGAYKTVSKAYDVEYGICVAWNSIPLNKLNDAQKSKIRDEIQMLTNLKQKHTRILNIHSSWINKDTNTVVFISDLFQTGSLRNFLQTIRRVKIKVIKRLLGQILEGLSFLHEKNIIHRDLKCDNIFYNETTGNLVIGDFGISRVTSDTGNASTILGTPEFMAPEVYDEKYNTKSDIYSFGMCLLEIATGEIPYLECVNVAQIWRKVTSNIKPEAIARIGLGSLCDLITRCLRFDYESRPTVEEIREHEFFRDTEYDDTIIDYDVHRKEIAKTEFIQVKTVEDEIEEALLNDVHLEESVIDDDSTPPSSHEPDTISNPPPPGGSETEESDHEEPVDGDI